MADQPANAMTADPPYKFVCFDSDRAQTQIRGDLSISRRPRDEHGVVKEQTSEYFFRLGLKISRNYGAPNVVPLTTGTLIGICIRLPLRETLR